MQWHSHWAAATGTQVLWWTDHEAVFDQTTDSFLRIDLGRIDPATLNVVGLGTGPSEPNFLKAMVTGGQAQASLRDDQLFMELQSDPQEEFQSFSYEPQGQSGTLKSLSWARPLSSGAVLEGEVDPGPRGDDAQVEIQVNLSKHFFEGSVVQHYLVFRLVSPEEAASPVFTDPQTVLVKVPIPAGRTTFSLDLRGPASLFPHGDEYQTLRKILQRKYLWSF